MRRIAFYLQYAFRNLWRSRRWSTFGIFSVAAGVATVVALRSLGLAINDSLTSNIRASNHGDISLQIGGDGGGFFSFGDPSDESGFSDSQIERLTEWVETQGGRLSVSTSTGGIQVTALDFNSVGRPQFITSYFIDPSTYPPTDDIRASDPAGVPLSELFTGGNEVVISENMASSQQIEVGDTVRVSGTTDEFIVRGIVPTNAEAGLRNLFAAFFGFAYFDQSLKSGLPAPTQPNAAYIALPDGADIEQASRNVREGLGGRGFYDIETVPELLTENQQIADFLGSFIVVMGLGGLLIGGVGIINTMLVLLRRRNDEIATLKTFGLKGRQIATLFMSEAVLLGLAGSIVGGIFGVLLSGLANAYGQTLIQQPLTWRVYPEAILFGFVLGMIITMVFGIIPVVIAVKVRPATILRPNELYIPRLGCLQSLLMIALVVLVIGLIAGQIISPTFTVINSNSLPSPFTVGIIGVAITLTILGLLVGILWLLVWLIGKLPAMGVIDLRLALRNLTTNRIRTATTLLAISAGMFALSSIAFFGAGVREIVNFTLSQNLGGNVLIFTPLSQSIANPIIDGKLDAVEGVEYRTRIANYFGDIVTIDGSPVSNQSSGTLNRDGETIVFSDNSVMLMARDTDNPNLRSGSNLVGRDMTLDDRGKPVAVVNLNERLTALGVQVGSVIGIRINEQVYEFEVIGAIPTVTSGFVLSNFTSADVQIPPEVIGTQGEQFQLNVIQVNSAHINNVLLELSSIPLVFAFDITFIDGVLSRFIDQMSAIPILVGILSLGAAAVIMANTVALATLERRRQIGVLKTVGLKGRRVLSVMLLENTLISLLGGLLGIGLSALGVALMTQLGISIAQLVPPDAAPVAIALVVVAVLIAWIATFLSARAAITERVTNVLRYE